MHVKIVFCCCILSDRWAQAHVCLKLTKGNPPQSNYASCVIFSANTEKESSLIMLLISTCFVGCFFVVFLFCCFFVGNQVWVFLVSVGQDAEYNDIHNILQSEVLTSCHVTGPVEWVQGLGSQELM